MVVFRDPGSVPGNWRPSLDEEQLEAGIATTLSNHVADGPSISDEMERRPSTGYCHRCQNGKPPRCHHCSVCK